MKKILLIMTAALLYVGSAWALSVTSVRTHTNQVWVTTDENFPSTVVNDWLLEDLQENTQNILRIQTFETNNRMYIITSDGNQGVNKDNVYSISLKSDPSICFVIIIKGYSYTTDVNPCVECFSSCTSPEPAVSLTLTPDNKKINAQWNVSNMGALESQTLSYSTDQTIWTDVPGITLSSTNATIRGLQNDVTYYVKVAASDGTNEVEAIKSATPMQGQAIPVSGATVANDLATITVTGTINKSHTYTLTAVEYPDDMTGVDNYLGDIRFSKFDGSNQAIFKFYKKSGSAYAPEFKTGNYVFSFVDVTDNSCSKLSFSYYSTTHLTFSSSSPCYVQETEKEFTFTRRIEKQKVLAIKSNATISRIEITNAAGKLVKEQDFDPTVTDVNVKIGQYDLGTYTVKIYDASGTTPENIKVLTAVY